MRSRSEVGDLENSEDSRPSWIIDHLGEGSSSFMTDEVNQSPESPREDPSTPEDITMVTVPPSVEMVTNIMTLDELDLLRESYYFPLHVRLRLPEEGDTIMSTHPGEVAFYEASFPAGLCFLIHLTIRLILQFYNIFPAQLVPNAWRSIACGLSLWRAHKYAMSLSEFRNLFSLNNNPKLDHGWLYFKARYKKTLLGGYPNNVKGWKKKFFFASREEWEFSEGSSREYGVLRVPKSWGIPGQSLFVKISFTPLRCSSTNT
ncbi:hypothetical protein Acr_10g0009790 [Actinidia rufa]|uniref:Uncharacterized protein n=1 Tax=Actinidia rufa TaxID=165716 RepID=A0A7J0FA67_9ERIC|nr:hypothetical protein Acr_10g0009790 [Actinidia rufa]